MSKKPKPSVVVTSNHIVEACYQLTLAEKRLVLAVISRLDPRPEAPPPEREHLIRADEYAELFDIPKNQAYEAMRDGADRLWERELWVPVEHGICPFIDRNKIRWVERIGYGKTKGFISVTLTPSIMPFLTALSREFTRYQLRHVVGLPTVYAIRLYEMLVQWRDAGEREIEVAWLRERFMLVDSYPSIKDLKVRVIDPAVKQINEHTDLWAKYTQRKAGRNVVALIFTFGPKTPLGASEKPVAASASKPVPSGRLGFAARIAFVEKHANPGESWEAAERRLINPDGTVRKRE